MRFDAFMGNGCPISTEPGVAGEQDHEVGLRMAMARAPSSGLEPETLPYHRVRVVAERRRESLNADRAASGGTAPRSRREPSSQSRSKSSRLRAARARRRS